MWMFKKAFLKDSWPWLSGQLALSIALSGLPAWRIVVLGQLVDLALAMPHFLVLLPKMSLFATLLIAERVLETLQVWQKAGLSIVLAKQARLLYFQRMVSAPYVNTLMEDWGVKAENAKATLDRGHRVVTLFFSVLQSGGTLIGLFIAFLSISFHGGLLLLLIFLVIGLQRFVAGKNIVETERTLGSVKAKESYYRSILSKSEMAPERHIFGFAPYILDLWYDAFEQIAQARQKVFLHGQFYALILQLAQIVLTIFVYVAIILWSTVSLGEFVIIFQLLNAISGQTHSFLLELGLLQQEVLTSKELNRFIGSEDQGAINLDHKRGSKEFYRYLQVKNVSFSYPYAQNPCLTDVNIELHKGKMVGLVGANGAGKTTLCNIIAGLLQPASGDILIDGHRSPSRERLGRVSVAYTDHARFPMTVEDNITLGTPPGEMRALKLVADLVDNQDDKILMPGFSKGRDLSTGQWQRLAVARSLVRHASFLILDEPTAGMDANTELAVMRLVRKTVEEGVGALVVAHRVNPIMSCDIVYVLQNGRIVEVGNPSELLSQNGEFERMYRAHLSILKQSSSNFG